MPFALCSQAQQVLLEFQSAVLHDPVLADNQKGRVFRELAAADKHLVDGSDEYLQLLNVASMTQRIIMTQA